MAPSSAMAVDVLAPDVVLLADGGGIAQAVRVPVVGVKGW